MKYLLFILLCMFLFFQVQAQKEDHVWIFGQNPYNQLPINGDTVLGGTNMDFNYDPVRIHLAYDRKWNIQTSNASVSDAKTGKLLAFSNGQAIVNGDNIAIEDTINYDYDIPKSCREWERANAGNDSIAIPEGLLGPQSLIFLPHQNKFYLLQTSFKYCSIWDNYRLIYHDFEINESSPKGKLITKDNLIFTDTLSGEVVASRHANGMDWWIVTISEDYLEIFVHLLDPSGINLVHTVKTGLGEKNKELYLQVNFSPNGEFLSWYMAEGNPDPQGNWLGGFAISNFDRCTGMITNIKSTKHYNDLIAGGVTFSPDSRYLYVCNGKSMLQYEPDKSDIFSTEKLIATYDGFYYTYPNDTIDPIKLRLNFGYLIPAPDGKIYIMSTSGVNQYMSVINYPEEKGTDCDVRQHSIKLNTVFFRTIPNYPNYRLGPLDGSGCDTLGLDNLPIAKYRYEPDSIDYKQIRFTDLSYFRPETWSWDFGDGSPKISQRSPYHTYAQNGTYRVCLTVSNENSTNTFCRDITIGPSAVDDNGSVHPADVTLFPNPVQDILLVTIGEYIPERGYIEIYSISGQQVHQQRAYYGHNNVDMSGFQAGTYVLRIVDGIYLIKEEKLVKVD